MIHKMLFQVPFTYPKRRGIYYKYSANGKLMTSNAIFYILLIFLFKFEHVYSQTTSTSNSNISTLLESLNSTFDQSDSSLARFLTPINEEYAAEIARFIDTNLSFSFMTSKLTSNKPFSISSPVFKLPTTIRRKALHPDILKNPELAKIEPSDDYSVVDIQSLDIGKSSDSFTRPEVKGSPLNRDVKPEKSAEPEIELGTSPRDDFYGVYKKTNTSSDSENSDTFCKTASSTPSPTTTIISITDSPTKDNTDNRTTEKLDENSDNFCKTASSTLSPATTIISITDSPTKDNTDNRTTEKFDENSDTFCKTASSMPSATTTITSITDSPTKDNTDDRTTEKLDDDDIRETNISAINYHEGHINEEEYIEAKTMTKCIPKDFHKGSIVCVCNKTYCDKMLPIRPLPAGKFSWYRSSYDGYRFHRVDGQLSQHTKDVKDALNVDTAIKLQTFIGFGGGFSDSACKNIESLSKETRKQLMRSYFGEFGLQYTLGRVPMAGNDFSPRFYTYMDVPKNFMLSEQDLKYKIPVIREAIEITENNLKLLGCSWTAPKWMKTNCSTHTGELKREYYQLYADYYVKFLDNYAKQGIKFWALSPGNRPFRPLNTTAPPHINGMEWSPYKQSKWVNRYLAPTLKEFGYHHIELIIGDENREIIPFFTKWFFEPLEGESYFYLNFSIVNEVYHVVSGISVHGYHDTFENEIFLGRLANMYPEKTILLNENACYGKPQLGGWICAERYAQQMMDYFYHWTSGFIDWNLVLNQEGGPNYLRNYHDAAIIVDLQKDEFYKQPMYYIIGHFSKFITPDSVRVLLEPYNTTSTGISAIAAQRPDNGVVIVAYNRSPKIQKTVFVIDKKYTLSLNITAKSINTVIFWT